MKATLFLNDYFKSYTPLDFYIYNILFFILKKQGTQSKNDLDKNLYIIINGINNNDISLMANYCVNYRSLNYLSKAKFILSKLFFLDIWKKTIFHEINNIKNYRDENKYNYKFDFYKYYFPIQKLDINPYRRIKPKIFYIIRNQLIMLENKEEMISKVKYDEEFKYFLLNKFSEEEKEITSRIVFSLRIHEVLQEIQYLLELDVKEQERQYLDLLKSEEFNIVNKYELILKI